MNILVTIPMDEAQKARLSAIAPGAQVVYTPEPDRITAPQVAQAEIILGNLPLPLLAHAKACAGSSSTSPAATTTAPRACWPRRSCSPTPPGPTAWPSASA